MTGPIPLLWEVYLANGHSAITNDITGHTANKRHAATSLIAATLSADNQSVDVMVGEIHVE